MHRLFTAAALIVTAGLISASADAANKSTPKLMQSAIKGKAAAASEPRQDITANAKMRRLRTAQNIRVQWQPGTVSTNVRITKLSFRVEREMKESGEKGGTEDINIGVGELQECTISKSMDAASPLLARLAKTRRPLPYVTLSGRDARGQYLTIRMKRAYIANYQTGSSAGSETATITFTGLE